MRKASMLMQMWGGMWKAKQMSVDVVHFSSSSPAVREREIETALACFSLAIEKKVGGPFVILSSGDNHKTILWQTQNYLQRFRKF